MRPPPRMRMAPPPLSLLVAAIAVHPGQDGGAEEHDDVHDAEGEAGLEHGAGLRDLDADVGDGEGAEEEGPVAIAGDASAVGPGNVAEEVHGGDEGADETEVD